MSDLPSGHEFVLRQRTFRLTDNLQVLTTTGLGGKNIHYKRIDAAIMRHLFGVSPGRPLPFSSPWRCVGNVRVLIDPPGQDFHRIKAECPFCFEIVPFGRLQQHQKGAACLEERRAQANRAITPKEA